MRYISQQALLLRFVWYLMRHTKTSTNISFNDTLIVVPVLQEDLFSILIRFRFHRYVITADISKMYRKILINFTDTKFNKNLCWFSPSEDLKIYELKTLTYGTCPASFIVTRCLNELASKAEGNDIISKIINSHFYMDNLITGSNSITGLKNTQKTVTQVLEDGGFFYANGHPTVLIFCKI